MSKAWSFPPYPKHDAPQWQRSRNVLLCAAAMAILGAFVVVCIHLVEEYGVALAVVLVVACFLLVALFLDWLEYRRRP